MMKEHGTYLVIMSSRSEIKQTKSYINLEKFEISNKNKRRGQRHLNAK